MQEKKKNQKTDEPVNIGRAELTEDVRAGHSNAEFRKEAQRIDEETFDRVESVKRPSKNYWKRTRIGRFLSGRTQAGRTFRRVGLGAATVGAGLLGVDVSSLGLGLNQTATGTAGDLLPALELIKEIVLIIGTTILAITKGADMTENYGEKADELEQKEGQQTVFRQLISNQTKAKDKLKGE